MDNIEFDFKLKLFSNKKLSINQNIYVLLLRTFRWMSSG